MSELVLIIINLHIKFEVPSFAHSKDMTGTIKFKIGHIILTTPRLEVLYHP